MRLGYSKMDEINDTTTTNPIPQRSGSKKEYAFLDDEVDLRLYRKKSQKQQNQPQPSTDDEDDDHDQGKNKIGDLIKNGGGRGGRKFGASLRRNFSVSAAPTYQKNGGIERQNSTRSIQGAVKRVFSLSLRRSSSVNSESYCRIYDQSSTLDDDDDDDDCHNDDDNDFEMRNGDDDESNNGSMKTRSVGRKKKKEQQNNGKKQNVGSRVLRACKRLFSR